MFNKFLDKSICSNNSHQDTSSLGVVGIPKGVLPQDINPSGQSSAIASPLQYTESDFLKHSSSSKTYKLSPRNSSTDSQSQTSQFGVALVQTFPWLVNEPELMELAESCFLKDSDSFVSSVHLHSCLKMSMDCLAQTKVLPSRKSSKRLQNWGIAAPGNLEMVIDTSPKTESGFSSWAITSDVRTTHPKLEKKSLQEIFSGSAVNSFTGEKISQAFSLRASTPKLGAGNKSYPNTFVRLPIKIYQNGIKEVDEAPTIYPAGWQSRSPQNRDKSGSSFAILYRAAGGDRQYFEEAPALRSLCKSGNHQAGNGAYKVREYQGEIYYERPINATEAESLMGWEINSTALGIDLSGKQIEISQTQRIKMLGNGIVPGEVTDILLGIKPMLERLSMDAHQQNETPPSKSATQFLEKESESVGCLYQYVESKKLHDGSIATYPRVIGERDPNNPNHWRWGFNWKEKCKGAWKGRSIGSIPQDAIAQIQKMQHQGVKREEIVCFITEVKAKGKRQTCSQRSQS